MVSLDPMVPGVAYMIGLLQTDGSHEGSIDAKGRVSLELAIRDERILERIAEILPCYSSINYRTRSTNFANNYQTATLRFYDQGVRRSIAGLGVLPGAKSRSIRPPDVPFAEPDYLRGLLDGDGSVGFTRRGQPFIGFMTASPAAAEFFCEIVNNVCGVTRTARRNKRDGVFNLMVLNASAAKLAAWTWYSPDVISIDRKHEAAEKVADWAPAAGKEGRYGVTRRRWTVREDEIVMSHGQAMAAQILGRTMSSVSVRKWRLRNQTL
ncbi:LAGLIDADG family homing endonuclease [Nocardia cyriacigeorgica]|uniref:Homing endonuclease LAGLIDADG domain-containing protein n=1 Tax=Nocardia cyriacigeorgica TaxID=135487 RepID=A0A4U8W9T4_9NOCA|nr:LAGLIDADG family homing endonuclease [Nocardia cyriacigeorgica]VFB01930.1 Uncharacterised protein [Nocardia cyriacigeorgica]